ncbi:MAG: hypothetical protein QM760_09350 [Nibricoccus sp.]
MTAPPPKIVLLPDAQFFSRVVPVGEAVTAADVAAQVELALEALAPFPLAQMYHGHFWKEGAKHALVFAAYRKRFTNEQTEEWHEAEIVMPSFAALLSAKVGRATTILLSSETTLTAVHWSDPADVPDMVVTRPVVPDTDSAGRAALRDELLRAVGESVTVKEPASSASLDLESDEGELAFRAGDVETSFTREELDALDVRDKDDLAARRRARARDLLLWRIFLGSAAAILFAVVLEAAVIGGKFWQRGRTAIVTARAPVVAEIEKANDLATRIEELSTKRLLPFEMIELIKSKQPPSMVFTRVTTTSGALYTLDLRGQTNVPNDIVTYQSLLNALPECQEVRIVSQQTTSGLSTFQIQVTFKPEAVKAEVQS